VDRRVSDQADRAQWEQASRVRAQREAEAAARAEVVSPSTPDDGDAGPGRPAGRRRRRTVVLAVAVAGVFLLAVAVMLVAIRHRSDEQPSWVAQLGLDEPGGATPTDASGVDRFGPGPVTPVTGGSGASTSTTTTGRAAEATPPLINTSGEDFDQVWRQIEVLESWLLEHPQPALAADIYVKGSAPYDDLVGQLTDLQSKGQSGRVDDYQILGVTVDSRPSTDEVHLRYADTYTDRLTLDGQGAVIAHQPYDGRARLWTLTLQRGDDHRWRVSATAFVSFGDVVAPAGS
jgi:hypothetical protein